MHIPVGEEYPSPQEMVNRLARSLLYSVEQRLIDLDIEIKTALHYQRPNMSKCLEHLDALLDLQVAPLMFKKQPGIQPLYSQQLFSVLFS